jgi:hypothetical protein
VCPPLPGPWYRILAVPAPVQASCAELDFVAVLPAVLSAVQRDGQFVVGWLCRGGGEPLELITNAGPLIFAAAPGDAAITAGAVVGTAAGLLFPHGARGTAIGDGWLADADRLLWTPCPGRPAPPLADRDAREPGRAAREPTLFESTLVTMMERPFGWLVVATPADSLETETAALRTRLNAVRRFDEERARLDVQRAERRMAELDAFGEAGLWNVRVLAGAATPAELHMLAPVLVGSADLRHHPYRLRGGTAAHTLADALTATATVAAAAGAAQVPFAATPGVLAALAGLPRREVPGVRVLEAGYFDVTSETGDCQATTPAIELGAILDAQDRPVGVFRVPLTTINRHVFVTGATGAGKSQTVRHLLDGLTQAGLPWLAIEPAKSEYAAMAGRVEGIAQVTVVNPADPMAIPLSVNPLAPEPGYPVQAHIDMVRALFHAAFDADEPFPQIMSQALQRVYEANGWDVVTGAGVPGAIAAPAVPTLEQLQRAALGVIEDVGYGKELQADVRGFVDVRLRALRIGSAGRFFEGGHPADIAELLRRNVVLAIEDVANDEDKAFLMGTLIIRIVEHLRLRARGAKAAGLRHVIVIEEAHRLLRNRGHDRASSHAVELFAGLLAEIRAYGEGLVVAEQIPAKLLPDVVKNTALKIVHRLPAHDDRQLVGAAMNLDDDQSRQVVSQQPGIAAVFADGMDRPVRIRVPLGEQRERVLTPSPPPIAGRRSAACGPTCRNGRACTLFELRKAELSAASPQDAWLRIWCTALVLAFLVGRPLPAVPEQVRRRWAGLDSAVRLRECGLATVVDRAVTARAFSLRDSYDPQRLTRSVADTALQILTGAHDLVGTCAGPSWVIPQLRWLHEADQALAAGPDGPAGPAPPLSYDIHGLADGPCISAEDRLNQLAQHPLSIELERNRRLAWNALLGEDEQAGLRDDIAAVMVGVDVRVQVAQVAAALRAGWLPEVLCWPDRYSPGGPGSGLGAGPGGPGAGRPGGADLPGRVEAAQPRPAAMWQKRALLGARPRGSARSGVPRLPRPGRGT